MSLLNPPICYEISYIEINPIDLINFEVKVFANNGQGYSLSGNVYDPGYYNFNTVNVVGMWTSNVDNGYCYKITHITIVSDNEATLTLNDVDGYNARLDPIGNGGGPMVGSTGYIFQLGNTGLPILPYMPNPPSLIWLP